MDSSQYALVATVAPIFLLVLVSERRALMHGRIGGVTKIWNVYLTMAATALCWCTSVGVAYATTDSNPPRWIDGSTTYVLQGAIGWVFGALMVLMWADRGPESGN